MEYEVILSGQAKEGFRKIVSYLLYEFGNEQAAANVIIEPFILSVISIFCYIGLLKDRPMS